MVPALHWEIELFFRWIKQTLRIKRFLATSENAVRIQIAVALIAYLLLRIDNWSRPYAEPDSCEHRSAMTARRSA